MPKSAVPLTSTQIKNLKAQLSPYKKFDGGGLYVLINPNGSKYWRMKACLSDGTNILLSFGVFGVGAGNVSLAEARDKRAEVKHLIKRGRDPRAEFAAREARNAVVSANTFEAVAKRCFEKKVGKWTDKTAQVTWRRLELHVFPHVGKLPIGELDGPVMLSVFERIEDTGTLEMASRVATICSEIFRFGCAVGLREYDPVPSVRVAMKKRSKTHHAALQPSELPEFLKALCVYEEKMFTPNRILMRMMMLVFLRTSELFETPWSEINFESETWIIPWQRMKMGKRAHNPRKVDHHVNVPKQGWVLLRELYQLTGTKEYLFPNQHRPDRPVSNGVILAALKKMGYGGRHTGHGFRSLAMGVIKERLGIAHEIVDRQLAHMSGDAYGEAYDRAEFLDQRIIMMQKYADYIDALEVEKVIAPQFGKVA